jgi:DnaJ domain
MKAPTEAYPLTWPVGWKRESNRTRARFSKQTFVDRGRNAEGQQMGWHTRGVLTIAEGTQRVLKVLDQMGFNVSVVISSNLALRNDGLPRSGQREPADPGVAVYWGRGNKARCIAVDRYDRIADNLGAIAATLEAMRAIERHGGAAILDRAFTGFTALPAPEQPFQVLGVGANASKDEIESAYRRLASEHHPDKGGDPHQMARINAARDALL